jgi:hypothetical protein
MTSISSFLPRGANLRGTSLRLSSKCSGSLFFADRNCLCCLTPAWRLVSGRNRSALCGCSRWSDGSNELGRDHCARSPLLPGRPIWDWLASAYQHGIRHRRVVRHRRSPRELCAPTCRARRRFRLHVATSSGHRLRLFSSPPCRMAPRGRSGSQNPPRPKSATPTSVTPRSRALRGRKTRAKQTA